MRRAFVCAAMSALVSATIIVPEALASDVIVIGDSNGYSSGANKCRSVEETATPSALAGAKVVFRPSGWLRAAMM